MSDERIRTRRDFVKETSFGVAGMTLGLSAARDVMNRPKRAARVVLVRHKDVLDDEGTINRPIFEQMLDDAMTTLFDTDDAAACWNSLLKPTDILGIKTNVYRPLPTPPELNEMLQDRAMAVGIPEENISTLDRGVLGDPNFQNSTALLNARPIRAHDWSGIGGCIKNFILFDRPQDWHEDSCADLGEIWHNPICRGKCRLNILVALTPLFHSIGPHRYAPDAVWQYKGMFVSTDPVAIDALGVKLMEEMRKAFYERPPRGGTSTKHVGYADSRHGLGVANLDEIELIKLGWMEDVLL